jgi:hypothetical protein
MVTSTPFEVKYDAVSFAMMALHPNTPVPSFAVVLATVMTNPLLA